MSTTRNDAKIIKNIDAITAGVIALVDLGAEHLLPKSVVKCVRDVEAANKAAEDTRGVLRMMCEDPG